MVYHKAVPSNQDGPSRAGATEGAPCVVPDREIPLIHSGNMLHSMTVTKQSGEKTMITKTRSNFVHISTVLVLGMALSSLVAPRAAAQKTPPGPSDVHVVNTATDPVPVKIDPATNTVKIDGAANTVKIDGATNTVKIDGVTNTVKAAQSGNWGVS